MGVLSANIRPQFRPLNSRTLIVYSFMLQGIPTLSRDPTNIEQIRGQLSGRATTTMRYVFLAAWARREEAIYGSRNQR